MTREALTAEQRAAYKTRAQDYRTKADQLRRLEDDISALEGWRIKALIPNGEVLQGVQVLQDKSVAYFTDGSMCHAFKGPLLHRVVKLGIDTLIAQLEQELADLGSKQLTPRQIERYPVNGKSFKTRDLAELEAAEAT